MDGRAQEAVFALIDAALTWHDVEIGAPGALLALAKLNGVIGSRRTELERVREGATITEDDYLALHRPAGGYTNAHEQRTRASYRRNILGLP